MKGTSKLKTRVNIAGFLKRKGIVQRELAGKLGCSLSLVGMYGSGRIVPSYEKCAELLSLGMTVSELFGEEVAKNVDFGQPQEKKEDFDAKVGDAIIRLQNKGFFSLIKR